MRACPMFAFGLAVLALCLSGCGGSPYRNVREQRTAVNAAAAEAVPSTGKAMVVASITAVNTDYHRRALIALPIYRPGSKQPILMRVSNGIWPNADSPPSDYGSIQGRLFSIELAPGDYQLWPWVVYDSEYFVAPAKTTYWSFKLKAGEVLYLGNFDFELYEGRHLASRLGGPSNIERVTFEFRDRFERDLQVLLKRYPGLKASAVGRNGPVALPWAKAPRMHDSLERTNLLGLVGVFPSLGGIRGIGGGAMSLQAVLGALLMVLLVHAATALNWGCQRAASNPRG